MESLLFLCQRLPFPPDKGDKIRSYRALMHLRQTHRIHLGTFIDDPDDERHVSDVEALCTTTRICRINPATARLRSLPALLTGEPLSKRYFASRSLATWVRATCADEDIKAVYVFSSVMAQYVMDLGLTCPILIDYVDVDSEKFRQYATERGFLSRIVYGREGRRLLAFDREAGRIADACLFVSEAEATLFRNLAPELGRKTYGLSNGIDTDYFDPDAEMAARDDILAFGAGSNIVFTGRMDYKPNIDAVLWFSAEVLPRVLEEEPGTRFIIAGAAPVREVEALTENPQIIVTGRVDDMRPYLAHADVAVAPMFIGRGIQNKVLEAAAMARPIVTTPDGLEGIDLEAGQHLLVAEGAEDFTAKVLTCLKAAPEISDMAARARQELVKHYAWSARMSLLNQFLPE